MDLSTLECVGEQETLISGKHLLLAPEKTVVKPTVPRLLCRILQTHSQWSRDRQGSCGDCPLSRNQVKRSEFAADFDERLKLITCGRRLFSQSAKAQPSLQSGSGWTRRRIEQRRKSRRTKCKCKKRKRSAETTVGQEKCGGT